MNQLSLVQLCPLDRIPFKWIYVVKSKLDGKYKQGLCQICNRLWRIEAK